MCGLAVILFKQVIFWHRLPALHNSTQKRYEMTNHYRDQDLQDSQLQGTCTDCHELLQFKTDWFQAINLCWTTVLWFRLIQYHRSQLSVLSLYDYNVLILSVIALNEWASLFSHFRIQIRTQLCVTPATDLIHVKCAFITPNNFCKVETCLGLTETLRCCFYT